jgi:hypothetical protein
MNNGIYKAIKNLIHNDSGIGKGWIEYEIKQIIKLEVKRQIHRHLQSNNIGEIITAVVKERLDKEMDHNKSYNWRETSFEEIIKQTIQKEFVSMFDVQINKK